MSSEFLSVCHADFIRFSKGNGRADYVETLWHCYTGPSEGSLQYKLASILSQNGRRSKFLILFSFYGLNDLDYISYRCKRT